MRNFSQPLFVVGLTLLAIACQAKKEQIENTETLTPADTYMGQTSPGSSAEVFAPGIISTDNFEFAITFSPKMDEIFFTRRKPEEDNLIYTSKISEGKWTEPEIAFFTTDTGWDFEPHISPKGDKLYFGSLRPVNNVITSGLHQWYCEKTPNGWSDPIALPSPIRDRFAMFLTSSEKGDLYFTSRDEGAKRGEGGIYKIANKAGKDSEVERMGDEINATELEWKAHPFIAPDESYMIFDAESESGYGDNDLYISFNTNGTWTKALNMGPKVNTDKTEMCASISPDGKYLFFHRGRYVEGEEESGDIYWIDFEGLKSDLKNQTVASQ